MNNSKYFLKPDKRIIRMLLVISVLATACLITFAGSVSAGNVTASGDPIAGALVKLVDYPQYNNTTDVNGNYAINNVPYGTYTISASAAGHTINVSTVNVDGATINKDFQLDIIFNKSVLAPGQVYTPDDAGWITRFTVFNFDNVNRSILIDFAADNGNIVNTTMDVMPALSFKTYDWSDIYALDGASGGSANVTSNTETLYVITEQRLANDFTVGRLGFFDAVQNNPSRTDYSVLGQVYTPGGAGWRTNFKISNIADNDANISMNYYRDNGSLITNESFVLPASGTIIKHWKTINDTYGVTSGMVKVTSDQPLIVKPSQAVDAEGGVGFWSGHAYSPSNNKFYIPELVYYNDAAVTRGNFKLTNIDAGLASLDITYVYLNGTTIYTKSDTLSSGATRLYNWKTDVYDTYGVMEGSVIIESDQEIATIASLSKNTGADNDKYKGIQINETHIFAGWLRYMDNTSSSLTVSNMASISNDITLRFLDKDGIEITTVADTLAANASSRYNWKTLIYDVYGTPEGSVEIISTQAIASLVTQDLISPEGRIGYFRGDQI